MSRSLTRRILLARFAITASALTLATFVTAAEPSAVTPAAPVFSRDVVLNAAQALAQHPFIPPALVPEALQKLDYDTYRKIRFNKNKAVWSNSRTRFSIEMFAPGSYYTSGVDLSLVENGIATPVQIDNDSFETPNPAIGELLSALGKVAGFRLHTPINTPNYQDEFLVFQGASYFRAVSKGQNYGLSARGLAIDVAEPTGEEFPVFRSFWIERPVKSDSKIVIHALLDSKRVTGAYRFVVSPGDPTSMDIEATLFARTKLTHIGLGALTSMFLFGDLDHSDTPDYRNAVHDSNGLAMLTGAGEYLWRPLNNPKNLQVSAFVDKSPAGFGLIQRKRNLSDYEDLEANYHKRPSAWITPVGDWGAGQVVLAELSTKSETNDNIVAYWRPAEALVPGTPFSFAYKLAWSDDSPLPKMFGRITRISYGYKFETQIPQLAIDYTDLPAGINPKEVKFEATVSQGKMLEAVAAANGSSGLRVFVTFDPGNAAMTEIRVQPRYQDKPLGETMLFRWLPH